MRKSASGKIRLALVTSVIDGREGRGTALVARELLTRLLSHTDEFEFTLIHHEMSNNPIYAQFPTLLIPHLPAPFDRQIFREIVFWIQCSLEGIHFDIVHYLHPRVWPSYLLTTSKKIVISMHEAGIMLDLHTHTIADRVFQYTNRFLNFRMDRIIAVSEFGRKEIADILTLPRNRVVSIYNGTDETFGKNIPSGARERLQEKYGLPLSYVLSVGRFDPHKNILRLIHAYAKAREQGLIESLVLVGGRHLISYSNEVERTICELGLSEHVYIAPFIPSEDLPSVYACARALVYPSLHEGFGLPLLEAMACDTPITCSNTTALPEIAGDAALLFSPTDTEDMTKALVRITKDQELRKILIERGRARISLFSWDAAAEKLIALYTSLT